MGRWLRRVVVAGISAAIFTVMAAPAAVALDCPQPPSRVCGAGEDPRANNCVSVYQGEITLPDAAATTISGQTEFDPVANPECALQVMPDLLWLDGNRQGLDSSGLISLSGVAVAAGLVLSILAMVVGAVTWAAAHYGHIGNGRVRVFQSMAFGGALAAIIIPNVEPLMNFGLNLLSSVRR